MLNGKLVLGYCPQGNGSNIAPFDWVFKAKQDISKSFAGVDAVVFWGGADIHPSLYKERMNLSESQASANGPSARDIFEWKAMRYCAMNNIPMIGVCRGAQLMCAFAGGKLVQHVEGHVGGNGNHTVLTSEGSIINTTSCHHQMMYPWDVEHELLAWAVKKLSTKYEGADGSNMPRAQLEREPEVVYFPHINGLAIQGHPEWMSAKSTFAEYCNELIIERLIAQVTV